MATIKGHGSRPRSSPSPCAACKHLKRRCMPTCIFKPYFKPEDLQKFANVHKVFGASNVSKLLNEVPVELREDAVTTLVYEAAARVRNPVYGCVADISVLQWKMDRLQEDLANARVRLAQYLSPGFLSMPSSSQPLLPAASASKLYNGASDMCGHVGLCGTSSDIGSGLDFYDEAKEFHQ